MGSEKQEEVGFFNEEEIVLFKEGFLKTLDVFQRHHLSQFSLDEVFFDNHTFFITYSFENTEFSNYRYKENYKNNKDLSDDNIFNFYESIIIATHHCRFHQYLTTLGIGDKFAITLHRINSLMESVCKDHSVYQDLLDIYVSFQDTLTPEFIEKTKQEYADKFIYDTISDAIDSILLRIKDTKYTIDDIIKIIQEKAILQMHEE